MIFQLSNEALKIAMIFLVNVSFTSHNKLNCEYYITGYKQIWLFVSSSLNPLMPKFQHKPKIFLDHMY